MNKQEIISRAIQKALESAQDDLINEYSQAYAEQVKLLSEAIRELQSIVNLNGDSILELQSKIDRIKLESATIEYNLRQSISRD